MSVIRTILIIIAAYYIIRLINCYILPAFKKEKTPPFNRTPHVTVDYIPKRKRDTGDKDDEYIEYEEVKK